VSANTDAQSFRIPVGVELQAQVKAALGPAEDLGPTSQLCPWLTALWCSWKPHEDRVGADQPQEHKATTNLVAFCGRSCRFSRNWIGP